MQWDFADITVTNCLQLTSLAFLFTYIQLLSNQNEQIWKNALFNKGYNWWSFAESKLCKIKYQGEYFLVSVLTFLWAHQHTPKMRGCCLLFEYFGGNNNSVSDLWEHQEGLRKAIKELLAGGNIPTHVVTLIYLAGLCTAASQHLSLLPQPHPCCSEICTPIKRYRCLWRRGGRCIILLNLLSPSGFSKHSLGSAVIWISYSRVLF